MQDGSFKFSGDDPDVYQRLFTLYTGNIVRVNGTSYWCAGATHDGSEQAIVAVKLYPYEDGDIELTSDQTIKGREARGEHERRYEDYRSAVIFNVYEISNFEVE